ncbi:MAG: serine/threonine protein kinase, partial [Planctomycetia bacterium]
LGLVTEGDWKKGAAAAADPGSVAAVLDALQRLPAEWDAGEDHFPALTSFQVDLVKQGQAERLRLQQYILLTKLGEGGMGAVYKARHTQLPMMVAVKTIVNDLIGEGTTKDSSNALARFKREAKILAKLDNRYITAVHHADHDHGVAFIAMDYVRGQDVQEIVEQSRADGDRVPIWWACERITAVAEALDHAHQMGIIHRDVKPRNIMITESNDLRVLDMGIARVVQPSNASAANQTMAGQTAQLTSTGGGMGTPDVMPPEQWADATEVVPASDVYSLGCTFYYIMAGRMPYVAENMHGLLFAHLNDPPPRITDLRDDAPAALDDVLGKMLAKKVSERYQTAREVMDALAPYVTQAGVAKAPKAARHGAGGGRLVATAGLAVAVLTLGLAAAFVFTRPQKTGEPVAAAVPKTNEPNTVQVASVATPGKAMPTETPKASTDPRRLTLEPFLDDLRTKNAKVWPKDELEQYVAMEIAKQSPAAPFDAQPVEKALRTATAARWRSAVGAEIDRVDKTFPNAWPNLAELQRYAENDAAAGSAVDAAGFERLSALLTAESCRREGYEWLQSFADGHSRLWKYTELKKLVAEQFPDDLASEADFARMKKLVEDANRVRAAERIEAKLSDYRKQNA